ncbi:MAG TPA: reactive intermediate/imine deaminase [Microscillaceae bacterium]|nr:reactive intermediate/imine deaminase [Microscillaceae bacterium]
MAHTIIYSPQAPNPVGPYSQAVRAGNTVFVSGQVAFDAQGNWINESIEAETHQVMQNIRHILAAAGLSLAHVAKVSIFLKNMDDFQRVNAVYSTYFEQNPPARETVQVSRLPKDVNIEISCIAVVEG